MNKFRSSLGSAKGGNGSNPLVAGKRARGADADDLASVPIERHETRLADHREGDRHRLTSEQVKAHWKGKARTVELINLSTGGAMIRAGFAPRLWDRVDLTLGEGPALECAVRWIRDDRIGLEFAHETRIDCDPELRDSTLLEVIRRTFPQVQALPVPDPADRPLVHAASTGDYDITRRTERRHPLIWSGQILYNHDEHAVRLRNISATGALVECETKLPERVEVMLDLGQGVQQFATVEWTRGTQAGLSFAAPFDLTRLAEARPEITPQNWNRPEFLRAPAQESPWDEHWDRPTIEQLQQDLEGFLKR